MFRLAHVTDPHFRAWSGVRLGDLLGKRAIGALNLALNRRRKHKMELLALLGEDVRAQAPDHLALTGDLSNVSIASEWRAALAWIDTFAGPADRVTVIPGNHDTYVPDVVRSGVFETLFRRYQDSDRRVDGATYPFVRLAGPLALIAVNSCVATGDLGAWGRIGEPQLARLEASLSARDLVARTRVVLIHHPPVRDKGGEERNLKDRQSLAEVLARAGADLVLHGHDHRDQLTTLPGPAGRPIPIVGAGSASYAGGADRRARYNIYEFDGGAITRVIRAHDQGEDAFREVGRDRIRDLTPVT